MALQIEQFLRQNAWILLTLMALQVVVFSYFYFSPIFSNHTFPNAFVVSFPSFKTAGEGRWMADLVILLQGSSGVQSFQMFVATGLQALNGVLFARICGIERALHIALVAALLCLYPAFLDYYSFNIDHVTFVLGDTLALLGLRAALLHPDLLRGVGRPALYFMLSLACYQPKVALVGTLCVVFFASSLARRPTPASMREVLVTGARAAAIGVAGLVLYFLSMKLTVSYDIGQRAYLNTPAQMLAETWAAYGKVVAYYWAGSAYLPLVLRWLPLAILVLGAIALRARLGATWGAQVVALSLIALVLPLALRAAYIINETTWVGAGRITFAHGYALIFGLICVLKRWPRLGTGLGAILLYFSAVTGSQETNAAAMKTVYESAMVNRIAARIEQVTPDLLQSQHPVAIFGHYPAFPRDRYLRTSDDVLRVHIASPMFEVYRHTEILNFFFGTDVVISPTVAQMELAASFAATMPPWPAVDSVRLQNGTIVVLLEPYTKDMPRTWTAD